MWRSDLHSEMFGTHNRKKHVNNAASEIFHTLVKSFNDWIIMPARFSIQFFFSPDAQAGNVHENFRNLHFGDFQGCLRPI